MPAGPRVGKIIFFNRAGLSYLDHFIGHLWCSISKSFVLHYLLVSEWFCRFFVSFFCTSRLALFIHKFLGTRVCSFFYELTVQDGGRLQWADSTSQLGGGGFQKESDCCGSAAGCPRRLCHRSGRFLRHSLEQGTEHAAQRSRGCAGVSRIGASASPLPTGNRIQECGSSLLCSH